MPIGIGMGPEVETSPQDRVGVAANACIGVYTTFPLLIVPGELTLWLLQKFEQPYLKLAAAYLLPPDKFVVRAHLASQSAVPDLRVSTKLAPSGNTLTAPDLVAGHCIVAGFSPSQVVFLQSPAAEAGLERNPSQVNISVNAINILT